MNRQDVEEWVEAHTFPDRGNMNDNEYADLLLKTRNGHRQCSLGWHYNCSSPSDCECGCHLLDGYDLLPLVVAYLAATDSNEE
jgi:hypothetical protein